MKKQYLLFVALLLVVIIVPFYNYVNAETQMSPKKEKLSKNNPYAQVPMLSNVKQKSSNQLEISFDQAVDVVSGTKATNYWIQATTDVKPSGIATMGKKDQVSASNSLTADKVKIEPVSGTNNSFKLTFKGKIQPKKQYKLIVCYVIAPGGAPYNGDNGMQVFTGK
jgi:hypothetical protein